MDARGAGDYRIEPECLGPLGDRPLAEQARQSSPDDLFPGASKFLSRRQQARRREQWNAVRPMAKRLLQPGEHILHVVHAYQIPPFLHTIGMGHFALMYHQVLLVVTDQRIIETMLNFRANAAASRMRTYAYKGLRDLKMSFGKLVAVPSQGKKVAWRLAVRGDKKLVDLLVPKLKTRLLAEGAAHAGEQPLWHCPRCGVVVPQAPEACSGCRTQFRSTRLATWLSLAFPGAGLFYLGYPFLGTMDFLGEALLFLVWISMMMGASPSEGLVPAMVVGAIFFLLTKIESVHLGHVLGARAIPETDGRRERARSLGIAGGVLSLVLVAGTFPLAAAARPRLERDLDVSTDDGVWSGSRKAADWDLFKDNPDARSQWTHKVTGARLTVFAHPQGLLDDQEQFHRDYGTEMQKRDFRTVADDMRVPQPFNGFRYIGEKKTKSGETVSLIAYFLYDQDGHDVHEVTVAVPREDTEAGEALIQNLLRHAKFVDAIPPQR